MLHRTARLGIIASLALWAGACGSDATSPSGPPTVSATVPSSGASAAGVATVIEVRYSREVVLPTATAAPVTVTRGTDTVPGTLAVRDGRVLTFTPSDILDPAESYTVQVSGVRDRSGNAASPHSWTFTTAGRAPASVDGARMYVDVERLAHDSMRGRRYGTADELKAATYIRAQLQQVGVEALAGNSWFQGFTWNGLASQNVYGVLRGTGSLVDEWVVIGAHYDHVGQTSAGIMNGADDNASGTAGMMELARALVRHAQTGGFGTQPRRSVLFMGFGTEEAGLVGSNFFCANPLVPLNRIAGMLNLDMIGRLRGDSLSAHGAESAPEWAGLLARYRGTLDVAMPAGLVGTDYRCFLQRGRPALALFTGLHEDYHRATDDAPLINVAGMVQVTNLAQGLAINLMLRSRMPGSATGT